MLVWWPYISKIDADFDKIYNLYLVVGSVPAKWHLLNSTAIGTCFISENLTLLWKYPHFKQSSGSVGNVADDRAISRMVGIFAMIPRSRYKIKKTAKNRMELKAMGKFTTRNSVILLLANILWNTYQNCYIPSGCNR